MICKQLEFIIMVTNKHSSHSYMTGFSAWFPMDFVCGTGPSFRGPAAHPLRCAVHQHRLGAQSAAWLGVLKLETHGFWGSPILKKPPNVVLNDISWWSNEKKLVINV
jgi:hypothetical protein